MFKRINRIIIVYIALNSNFINQKPLKQEAKVTLSMEFQKLKKKDLKLKKREKELKTI